MQTSYEITRGEFTISTDSDRLDLDAVSGFLARAYWAQGRPRAAIDRAYANSLVFGLYDGTRQIGMARVVSDTIIFAYLMDVFVQEDYRGRGLGRWLVESVLAHPDLKDVRRWMLTTQDAHGLYARCGFQLLGEPGNWMEWVRPFPSEA